VGIWYRYCPIPRFLWVYSIDTVPFQGSCGYQSHSKARGYQSHSKTPVGTSLIPRLVGTSPIPRLLWVCGIYTVPFQGSCGYMGYILSY
jgi:hypothetical protein